MQTVPGVPRLQQPEQLTHSAGLKLKNHPKTGQVCKINRPYVSKHKTEHCEEHDAWPLPKLAELN